MEIDGILYERAALGVDGNCAFALLGPNIQEGEAEFVELPENPSSDQIRICCSQAWRTLKARLNQDFSYYFGPGHPFGS